MEGVIDRKKELIVLFWFWKLARYKRGEVE